MYIRVADKCEPVRSEDISRVGEEKGAYQWELVPTQFELDEETTANLSKLADDDIRNSDRVKQHIKQLDDLEIGEHFHLIDGLKMTNLGVLWIGTAKQRSRICYPITVEYIVYDELENKTIEPHILKALIKEDLHMHPMSKISEITSRIPDVDIKDIRKMVYAMVGKEIEKEGSRTNSRYYLK